MPTAIETVTALFEAVNRRDTAGVVAFFPEDLHFEMPFERGSPVLDRAGFQQMFSGIENAFQRFEMNVVELIEGADPTLVVARYEGDCLTKDGGFEYRNRYIATFTVVDGRVVRWIEYANPVLSRRLNEQVGITLQ